MNTVDKIMALADTYADGPHTEGYFGAHREALRAAIVEALDLGEPIAYALLTNGKPRAPVIRCLSYFKPNAENLEIAAIENETWVSLYAKDRT